MLPLWVTTSRPRSARVPDVAVFVGSPGAGQSARKLDHSKPWRKRSTRWIADKANVSHDLSRPSTSAFVADARHDAVEHPYNGEVEQYLENSSASEFSDRALTANGEVEQYIGNGQTCQFSGEALT